MYIGNGDEFIHCNSRYSYRHIHCHIRTPSLFTNFAFLSILLGPTVQTVNDMWRMVWEQRTYSIVMVTSLVELGKVSDGFHACRESVKHLRERGPACRNCITKDAIALYTMTHCHIQVNY